MLITPAVVPNPLSDFQKIAYNTYIYTGEKYAPASAPLVLLFMWNAAAAKVGSMIYYKVLSDCTLAYSQIHSRLSKTIPQCAHFASAMLDTRYVSSNGKI